MPKQNMIAAALLPLVLCVVAAHAQPAAASGQPSAAAGQQVFVQKCMQCHSVNKDQVLLGPSLWGEMTKSPHKKTAAQIRVIIKNGKGKMPPWGTMLSEQDIDNVLAYLHSL
jgi:mono/diheme cytochrome c family protein